MPLSSSHATSPAHPYEVRVLVQFQAVAHIGRLSRSVVPRAKLLIPLRASVTRPGRTSRLLSCPPAVRCSFRASSSSNTREHATECDRRQNDPSLPPSIRYLNKQRFSCFCATNRRRSSCACSTPLLRNRMLIPVGPSAVGAHCACRKRALDQRPRGGRVRRDVHVETHSSTRLRRGVARVE
jgi:hypothetical protein